MVFVSRCLYMQRRIDIKAISVVESMGHGLLVHRTKIHLARLSGILSWHVFFKPNASIFRLLTFNVLLYLSLISAAEWLNLTSHDQTPVFPVGCQGSDLEARVFLHLNLKNSFHQYFSAVKQNIIKQHFNIKNLFMQLLKVTMRIIWDVPVYKFGSLSFRETSWTFEMKLVLLHKAASKLPRGMRNVQYNCVQTPDGVKLKRSEKAEGILWCLQHAVKANSSANANLLTHISDGQRSRLTAVESSVQQADL